MSLHPFKREPNPEPTAEVGPTVGAGRPGAGVPGAQQPLSGLTPLFAGQTPNIPSEGARGESIGPYKLLDVIGIGGFGQVWLAERREPMVQRVALKIIKAGMDTRAVIARFEQERQALAVMDHPNVAKVFDAGATVAGRPYFVMEHVPGEPITAYADRHNLSVRARLELFIPVCEAIQHAHHKGIIHRDIKPSNILVAVRDGKATPKIIDFGVAKAISHTLTDHSIFTETGQLIGTPEYMSPEQAEMGATDVDTRTDVYSLGVVLYELLAGLLPFDARALRAAGYDAIRKMLRDQDAPKPSTRLSTADAATGEGIAKHRVMAREQLAKELRRELDWIPLKALRKDRTERYDTPADLAKDIQRYLSGEALEAGPESAGYRVRKFLRRNRGRLLAAAAVPLVLALGALSILLAIVVFTRSHARDPFLDAERLASRLANEKQLAAAADAAQTSADAARAELEARGRTIEYNAYVTNIQLAGEAYYGRQFERLRQRLDACPERLRGWEWKWLNASSDNSLTTLKGHTDGVRSAAFSPDSTWLVTASGDNTASVWDAKTGAGLAVLHGHSDWVNSATFSPDSTRIVTASGDYTARVWDAVTGASLAELRGHTGKVLAAAFSPDSTRIVTTSDDNTARVWNATSGTSFAELEGHTGRVLSAAFGPDGTRIVTASDDNTARVWDAATGAPLAELGKGEDWVSAVAFSPDGTRIISTSENGAARVWDAATLTLLTEREGDRGKVLSIGFAQAGIRIVKRTDDDAALVWDMVSNSRVAGLHGHTCTVLAAAFSGDGARIATAGCDGTARIWDAATGAPVAELMGHTGWVSGVSFGLDGTRIATVSWDGTARVWDAATGVPMAKCDARTAGAPLPAVSPDGTRRVESNEGHALRLVEIGSGATLAELVGHKDEVLLGTFSRNGTRILTVSVDGTARVWDAATGAPVATLDEHRRPVTAAAFSPDGTRIVATNGGKFVQVWDAATGAQLVELRGHMAAVHTVLFSDDGMQVFTEDWDGTTRTWDSVPYRERFSELQARGLRK